MSLVRPAPVRVPRPAERPDDGILDAVAGVLARRAPVTASREGMAYLRARGLDGGEALGWYVLPGDAVGREALRDAILASSGQLLPGSKVEFSQLIPGARFVIEAEDDCGSATSTYDLARMSFGPGDLGAALLCEVALAYAGDWFVAPVPLATGALHRLVSLQVTDTFGVRNVVRAVHDVRPDPAWALWRLTGDQVGWLLIPEVTATSLTGEAIEDVELRRDELANAGWAIERVVPDTLGRGQRRATVMPPGEISTAADWRYAPLPRLPGDRVPLLRQAAADGARLVRAGVVDAAMGAPEVVGRIVTPTFAVHDGELRRVGAVVTRRWQLALDANGVRHAWCTRARGTARPAAGVRVAFDDLIAAPASATPADD